MKSSSTVRGGQEYEKALELHQEAAAAARFVSKSIYHLGHNSRVDHSTDASTLPGGRHNHKKRALELHHLREEDEDDEDEYWEEEATFVAGADGAYTNFEMPKRIHLGYNVGVSSALIRSLQAEEERDVALRRRHRSEVAAMIRDMYAKAAMAKAAAAPRT